MADLSGYLEFHECVTRLYPDLPPHEAYLKFYREILAAIRPNISHIDLPEFMRIVGDHFGSRNVQALARMWNLLRARTDTPQALQTVAFELRAFRNPLLIGQIANIGGVIVGVAALHYMKKFAEQAERIADNLGRIGDHIRSRNLRGDDFPGHVHSFVRSMIERHQGDPAHYFFVFNPGTEWQPKFDDINRSDPLGPHYLGYSHDMDELVDFLIRIARPRLGPNPILHILIPVVSQLAITESLTFPDELGPFRVSGQLNDAAIPSVYLCMPLEKDTANFQHIGSLSPRPRWVLMQRAGLFVPFFFPWLTTRLEDVFFDDPLFAFTFHVGSPLYCSLYEECDPIPPRTLGTTRTI